MTQADPLATERRPFRVAAKPVRAPRIVKVDRFQISPIDYLFGFVVIATFVAYIRMSNEHWFSGDDWPLALRGATLGDFLEPYNKHLSISIITIYRVMFTIFGFDTYLPLQIAGIVCFVGVAVAFYCVLRRRVGPFIAAFVASYLLWFPGLGFAPALLNHYLAVLGAVVCAWALTRDDRTGDLSVAGGLIFALCAAGGGLSVIAACLVHAACTRARLSRWIAVAAPSAAWLVWFLAYGRGTARQTSALALSTEGMIREGFEGVLHSFESLAFGSRPLGIVLALAFLAHLGWRLQQGLVASANVLAWTAALVVWWAGLTYSRGFLVDTETFRYMFVSASFIVLAMIPPAPLKLPDRTRSLTGAVAVALLIGFTILVNRPSIADQAEASRALARQVELLVLVANQGTTVIPDDYQFPPFSMVLTGKQYREVIDRWGYPPGTQQQNVDARIAESGIVDLEPVDPPADPCTRPESLAFAPGNASARVRVHTTANRPTTVAFQRFGAVATPIGDLGPNQAAEFTLPALISDKPWVIGAPGACIETLEPAG